MQLLSAAAALQEAVQAEGEGDSTMLAGDVEKHSRNFSKAAAPGALNRQKVMVGNKGGTTEKRAYHGDKAITDRLGHPRVGGMCRAWNHGWRSGASWN